MEEEWIAGRAHLRTPAARETTLEKCRLRCPMWQFCRLGEKSETDFIPKRCPTNSVLHSSEAFHVVDTDASILIDNPKSNQCFQIYLLSLKHWFLT